MRRLNLRQKSRRNTVQRYSYGRSDQSVDRSLRTRSVLAPKLNVLQRITERTSINAATTSGGNWSTSISLSASGLMLAARLGGYQAIADEARLDYVRVVLEPLLGMTTAGRLVLYIERDPTAAIVATPLLASGQRECSIGTPRTVLSIEWRPQQPTDRTFNLLNPGTVALGKIYGIADNLADGTGTAIPVSTSIFTLTVLSVWTLRGRP